MKSENKKKDYGIRNSLIKLAAIAVTLYLTLTFIFGIYRMNGNEMYPAVRDGDLCITYRLDDYYSGDIIAYHSDSGIRFARIVARAGDTVDADETATSTLHGDSRIDVHKLLHIVGNAFRQIFCRRNFLKIKA